MRQFWRRDQSLVGDLVVALLGFWILGSALHRDHPIQTYQPTCPACQLERTCGCQNGALVVAEIILAPVLLYTLPNPAVLVFAGELGISRLSPRGPPSIHPL